MTPQPILLTITPYSESVLCDITYNGSSIPTEYLIFYYQQNSKIVKSFSSSTPSGILIQNLTNGVTYYFYASIYSSLYSNGTVIIESQKISSIPSDLPTQPSNFIASVSTSGNDLGNTVQLSWSPSTCFYPITQYNIYQNDTLIHSTSDLSYTVENLNLGQSYNFKVSGEQKRKYRYLEKIRKI